jgi:uncharacterized protein YkwD
MSMVTAAIALTLMAGCASEDPNGDPTDPDIEAEEGVVGDPAEAVGDGSLPDALLPAYCDTVNVWPQASIDFENQVLTLVNQKRAAGATCSGVVYPPAPALVANDNLRCAARKHSKDMGDNNFFSHTGSNGSAFSTRITQAGYSWTAAAENIGAGYTTPAAAVNGWMASSGHCKNIMSATYVHLGVGYYYAPNSTYKHYWTQDFGKP